MAPTSNGGGGKPKGNIAKVINHTFGSFENFQAQFFSAAASVEGSGWGALSYAPMSQQLIVHQIENQHKLLPAGTVPILAIDVWEHAYYLKYQNKRKDYIRAWWNIVNWDQVNRNLEELS